MKILSLILLSSSLTNAIYEIISSAGRCTKLLDFDGITSKNLVLRNYDSSILINCKDVKAFKELFPLAGDSFAIIKNLDEYQYILCKYIPELNDSNFYKLKFQKIRIIIFLIFKYMSDLLLNLSKKNKRNLSLLEKLNKMGNSLLLEISDIILKYREDQPKFNSEVLDKNNFTNNLKLKLNYFTLFEIKENTIDNTLCSMYGIGI